MKLVGRSIYRAETHAQLGIGSLTIVNNGFFPHKAWRTLRLRAVEGYEPWTKINNEVWNNLGAAKGMQ